MRHQPYLWLKAQKVRKEKSREEIFKDMLAENFLRGE
jgi:hypothetical protein